MTKTQKHISKLISKQVDWMARWTIPTGLRQEECNKTAKSIIKYLTRKGFDFEE